MIAKDAAEDLTLGTPDAPIRCRLHRATAGNAGIVWVFGAGGGLGGPAGGIYERLARTLQVEGITSLQLDYRRPAHLDPCVEDTLAGAAYVRALGIDRVIFVGHSFGGAVAIAAGVVSPDVIGVAALSSQTRGAEAVGRLSPKSLLLIHGEADEILPAACSSHLFGDARDARERPVDVHDVHGRRR